MENLQIHGNISCNSFILILRTQKMDSWWMLTNKLIMFVTSLLRIPNYSQGTMPLAFRRVDSFCEYFIQVIYFIISRSGIGRISHILNNWPSCLNLNLVRVTDKWINWKRYWPIFTENVNISHSQWNLLSIMKKVHEMTYVVSLTLQ